MPTRPVSSRPDPERDALCPTPAHAATMERLTPHQPPVAAEHRGSSRGTRCGRCVDTSRYSGRYGPVHFAVRCASARTADHEKLPHAPIDGLQAQPARKRQRACETTRRSISSSGADALGDGAYTTTPRRARRSFIRGRRGCRSRSGESGLVGVDDDLGAVAESELVEEARHVRFDGGLG